MEFRILGPLEVLEDGQQVDLGGAKQRALLAVLLLHANEVVSTDRLIDALWEEEAPESGRKALQVYVSGLRKALGKDRLQTRSPGYLLRVEAGELDLERFQALVSERRPGEALSLWRGPPLAEFAYQRFAQAEIARLEELRLACLEERIEADLGAGRQAALVGELERLVATHPQRERLRGQLMLALYRSGRQAEALEAYQQARRALTEELGIEPSRELRELQQAILEQSPALDPQHALERPDARPVVEESFPLPLSLSQEPDLRAERKTVTAVNVLVTVTSEHAERLDPEVLRHVLSRALGEISAAIEAHEGTIESVAGDAVSGVFGLPRVHEDDPVRASRAAEEIRSRLQTLALELEHGSGPRLDASIGVSTGEVMAGGASGARLRATGEPLSAAARLAQLAGAGEVLLDDATRRAVDREGSRFSSPMVGRERERRRLHDAFEQAAVDRSCQLFTILGAAGVGKSRLAQEFLTDLAGRTLVARGRCLPYGEGITFWPILEAVKEVAGLDDAGAPEEASSRVAELIVEADDADVVARRVTDIVGLTEASAGVEEGFAAVRRFLELLAARQPLVVVFDDIHWGEATFLDLVEYLADWSRGAPILLLCMARPELLDIRPSWGGGKMNATSVLLEPLAEHECVKLVANLVGEVELAAAVEARIVEAAEGNPLFVEEMLSMLIDDGLLVREDGRWAEAGDLAAVPVPRTIRALLAARLDRLDPQERRVMECAAVEGKLFHRGSVEELAGAALAAPAQEPLGSLVRKELIRPEKPFFAAEHAYRFRHLLIRDAAYESIPKEVRAGLHERHADWLEGKTDAVEYEEIIGYHLEQAYRYQAELGSVDEDGRALGRRAAARLGAAGRRALLRSDASAGVNLISRAVALLPPDDPFRVELVPNVRVVQGMPDLSWADRVLTEAIEAAAMTGDRRLAAHALVQRGLLRLFTEADITAQEVLQAAQQAIAAFEDLDDDLGLARAWRLLGQAHYLARRGALSVEANERALGYALRAGDRFEEHEIVEWLLVALILGPTPAPDAIERCERLLVETRDSPQLRAQILAAMAPLVAMQGRTAEATEFMMESRGIMDDQEEWIWIVTFWWGFVNLWRGDPAAGERELRPAYEGLKRIGEKSHFSSICHALASVTFAQGRYDVTERLTRECEEAARANDVHSQILWRSIRAKVFAHRGSLDEAERLAREAVEIAETSDFLFAHGDALSDFAEILESCGRREEAAEALARSIDLYEQKGNALAAETTRARLNGLRRERSGRA